MREAKTLDCLPYFSLHLARSVMTNFLDTKVSPSIVAGTGARVARQRGRGGADDAGILSDQAADGHQDDGDAGVERCADRSVPQGRRHHAGTARDEPEIEVQNESPRRVGEGCGIESRAKAEDKTSQRQLLAAVEIWPAEKVSPSGRNPAKCQIPSDWKSIK